MGPSKNCWFWCNGPSTKAPQIPLRHQKKNIPFGTIFIELGDTKKCCTFSGLELAPKSRKKLIGALSCMHKGPKCIQSLWDHPKKIPFLKSAALFQGLLKKVLLAPKSRKKLCPIGALQLHAGQRSQMHSNPSGTIRKKFLFCKRTKRRDMCDAKEQRRRECAILREKTPFLAFPEAKKGVVSCARLPKAAHWPNNNANPLGLSEEKVYCLEKRDMCDP